MKQRLPEDCLPAAGSRPELIFTIPELQYLARLNACEQLLDRNVAAQRGGRPAIFYQEHQGRAITFDELHAQVETFAASLLDQGLVAGDRVWLRFWNQPEFIVAWLAVLVEHPAV